MGEFGFGGLELVEAGKDEGFGMFCLHGYSKL